MNHAPNTLDDNWWVVAGMSMAAMGAMAAAAYGLIGRIGVLDRMLAEQEERRKRIQARAEARMRRGFELLASSRTSDIRQGVYALACLRVGHKEALRCVHKQNAATLLQLRALTRAADQAPTSDDDRVAALVAGLDEHIMPGLVAPKLNPTPEPELVP